MKDIIKKENRVEFFHSLQNYIVEVKRMEYTELVLEENIEAVKEKVNKLNKKAKKLGVTLIDLYINPNKTYKIIEGIESPMKIKKPAYEVKITYSEIKLPNNYIAIGVFKRIDDKIMVNSFKGQEVPKSYYDKTDIKCEHCKQKRDRGLSILLQNEETKQYIEVGSTCINDFLGHEILNVLYFYSEIKDGLDEEFQRSYKDGLNHTIEEVLDVAIEEINKNGYIKRENVYNWEESTNGKVTEALKGQHNKEIINKEEVATILNIWKDLKEENEYQRNCKLLIEMGEVPNKYNGYVCSMVIVARSILKAKKLQEQKQFSNYLGNVGDKMDFKNLTVIFTQVFEGGYGCTYFYMFKDVTGNIIVWNSSNCMELEKDNMINLKGTVKKHEEYKGTKNTVMVRCKIENIS